MSDKLRNIAYYDRKPIIVTTSANRELPYKRTEFRELHIYNGNTVNNENRL